LILSRRMFAATRLRPLTGSLVPDVRRDAGVRGLIVAEDRGLADEASTDVE
jgi:hypothetical protein